ncbi:MAG: DUF3501 family protein [Gammaproteobacteria bacterium]|nr:DUF3501 family protein [Gammaproteobacteria bacterium]
MLKVTRNDLMPLEHYSAQRDAIRARVMQHKLARRIAIGPHATLYFEDFTTIQYQIQEMLRAERIFEAKEIDNEIAAYNPLVPDGHNWKATFMLEYEDVAQRRAALAGLIGIEQNVWVQVIGLPRVMAIADEDLDRNTEEKTSAVHFLRFELSPAMIAAAKEGAGIAMGIEHPNYHYVVSAVSDAQRAALVRDLD